MALGKRRKHGQELLFVAAPDLPGTVAHPFYVKLNGVLAGWKFDDYVEELCQRFYHETLGQRSLASGKYFRLAFDRLLQRDRLRAGHRLAGGQRGHAVDRAEGHQAEPSGVPHRPGQGQRDRHADAGTPDPDREDRKEQGFQRRLGKPPTIPTRKSPR